MTITREIGAEYYAAEWTLKVGFSKIKPALRKALQRAADRGHVRFGKVQFDIVPREDWPNPPPSKHHVLGRATACVVGVLAS